MVPTMANGLPLHTEIKALLRRHEKRVIWYSGRANDRVKSLGEHSDVILMTL